eukprot:scaffold100301_cov55-Attheya_sp.AAC.3
MQCCEDNDYKIKRRSGCRASDFNTRLKSRFTLPSYRCTGAGTWLKHRRIIDSPAKDRYFSQGFNSACRDDSFLRHDRER